MFHLFPRHQTNTTHPSRKSMTTSVLNRKQGHNKEFEHLSVLGVNPPRRFHTSRQPEEEGRTTTPKEPPQAKKRKSDAETSEKMCLPDKEQNKQKTLKKGFDGQTDFIIIIIIGGTTRGTARRPVRSSPGLLHSPPCCRRTCSRTGSGYRRNCSTLRCHHRGQPPRR